MIYSIIRFFLLMLPYWLIIQIYKMDKALPANIKTKTGKTLKAIMVTETYGIIFTEKEYTKNRVRYLRQQQQMVNNINESIAKEINSLGWEAKEAFFEEEYNENTGIR